ncbi:hypothetical protein [Falsiroseomonas sp. HW251]|uniref:hypothetical protein n=1 Tax=Falsiroseomonas sp. HW251 TaxID=3390998 RepID=UPI003D316D9C
MRRFALSASLAIAACAAEPPPRAAAPAAGQPATPVSAQAPRPQGTPAQQLIQEYRQGPMAGSGGMPGRQGLEPPRDDFDIGATGQLPGGL